MSVIIWWNDLDYEVDPSELLAAEMKLIKQRTGMGFSEMVHGLVTVDPEAVQAIFWINDHRRDPEIKFSEYSGPPLKVFVPSIPALSAAMEELGKDMPDSPDETSGSGG